MLFPFLVKNSLTFPQIAVFNIKRLSWKYREGRKLFDNFKPLPPHLYHMQRSVLLLSHTAIFKKIITACIIYKYQEESEINF